MDIGGIVRREDVVQRGFRYKFRASKHLGRNGGDVVETDPVLEVV